jgi:uncharacterized protein (TIGR03435 family)
MPMRRIVVAAFAAAIVTSSLSAQQPNQARQFEAASVKRNNTLDFVLSTPRVQGETFTARQVWVELLISYAYSIPIRELVEGPGWVRESSGEYYDVVAKAAPGSLRDDVQAMVRGLLEDRFKLRLRREKREIPVYLLMRLDERGGLGPNLKPAVNECPPRATCGVSGVGYSRGLAQPWSMLLQSIVNAVRDRRVLDRTGLSGRFDFDLTFRQALSADPGEPGVDIFTAVQQQLGLKLEPAREPFEVGVIEHIERPTPD